VTRIEADVIHVIWVILSTKSWAHAPSARRSIAGLVWHTTWAGAMIVRLARVSIHPQAIASNVQVGIAGLANTISTDATRAGMVPDST